MPDDEILSTTCEIMDPVRLKFGETYFVYPAWYDLSVTYDYGTNPILRRRATIDELRQGIVGTSGFCKPVDNEHIEPNSVTFHGRNFGTVSTFTEIIFPEGVEYFGKNTGKGLVQNSAYQKKDLRGTNLDFAYCDTNNTPERGLCTLIKKIDGTDIYLNARISPARPSSQPNEFGISYTKDEWSGLMNELEGIVRLHIE